MTWPPENTEPTAEMPWYCDGEYGTECLRVSPEGNVYGDMRWVAQVPHKLWWTGSAYRYVQSTNMWMSEDKLPTGADIPFGRIDKVLDFEGDKPVWREYWYDSESRKWRRLRWLWPIDGFVNLPRPGVQIGAAHEVIERDVLHVWNGFRFQRPRHGMLHDDEPERHLPAGFLKTLTPDARVVYYSPTEIGLEAVTGGSGRVLVNLEWINAGRQASAFAGRPGLEWDDASLTLIAADLQTDTEYWIYLANSDAGFQLQQGDYRSKLFLSMTEPYNGYMGSAGLGANARLVGQIETDSTAQASGGPFFRRELDVSLISRTVSLPETFRDYSDFTFKFLSPDTCGLVKADNARGLIYCAGELVDLFTGYTLHRSDPWVEWNDGDAAKVHIHETALAEWATYHAFLAGDIDAFNFNATNPATNRPWQATDQNASGHYVARLDLRKRLFLTLKEPEEGLLSEEWPGYWTRYCGSIHTGEGGEFLPAADMSAFRQALVSEAVVRNIAEVTLVRDDDTTVRLVPKRGSNGMIMVLNEPITVPAAGLSWDMGQHVLSYVDGIPALDYAASFYDEIYLYLTSHEGPWADVEGVNFSYKLMACRTAPTQGYLDIKWPGNTARYVGLIATNGWFKIEGAHSIVGAFDTSPAIWTFNTWPYVNCFSLPSGGSLKVDHYVRTVAASAGAYVKSHVGYTTQDNQSGSICLIECHQNGYTAQVMQGSASAMITTDADRVYYLGFATPEGGQSIAEAYMVVERILAIA